MQMTLKKIVPTNKIVDAVYEKHIAHEQKALLNKPKQTSYIVSEDQVHLIRCLSLFMRVSAISRLIGISDQYVSKIKRYEIYRSVVCSFQNTPYKRLGKIYFEIDVDKLQEYISSLPNEYKDICNLGKLNLDDLVYKSKIRSGE
jgi:hypothetical protein